MQQAEQELRIGNARVARFAKEFGRFGVALRHAGAVHVFEAELVAALRLGALRGAFGWNDPRRRLVDAAAEILQPLAGCKGKGSHHKRTRL
jgi:hypothetical protein